MNNTINITVRAFPVRVRDMRSGTGSTEYIVLTKEQLQAAALMGMDNKDLINRIYNRQGYKVLEVGMAIKQKVSVDLYSALGEIVIDGKALLSTGKAVPDEE